MASTLTDDLDALGWSQAELARRFGISSNAVNHWAQGKRTMPGAVRAYVAACRAALEAVPVPDWTPIIGRAPAGGRMGP